MHQAESMTAGRPAWRVEGPGGLAPAVSALAVQMALATRHRPVGGDRPLLSCLLADTPDRAAEDLAHAVLAAQLPDGAVLRVDGRDLFERRAGIAPLFGSWGATRSGALAGFLREPGPRGLIVTGADRLMNIGALPFLMTFQHLVTRGAFHDFGGREVVDASGRLLLVLTTDLDHARVVPAMRRAARTGVGPARQDILLRQALHRAGWDSAMLLRFDLVSAAALFA